LNIENKCTLLKDGTLEGTLNLTGDGAMDGRLRGYAYWFKQDEILNRIASIIGKAGDRVEIIKMEHGDILDFHKAMWWKISYRIPGFAMYVDSGYEFISPMMQMIGQSLYRNISTKWPEERRDDLFIWNTAFINGHESISLPSGYKVAEPPAPDSSNATYASFNGSSEMKGGKLLITQEVKAKRRQIPSKGYAGFCKVMKAANDFGKTEFRAEKGGAK
jgi:hypothetical protein